MKVQYIIISFLLCLLSATGMRAQPILLRIANITVTVGDTFDLPVFADSSFTGQGVVAYQLKITYNSSYLEFIEPVVTGGIASSFGTPVYNANNPGTLYFASAGTMPLAGSGPLLFLRFKGLQASGGISVAFAGGTPENYFNEGSPLMTTDNGTVRILALPSVAVSPSSAILTRGDSLQFSASGGISPYTWSVSNTSIASINPGGMLHSFGVGLTQVSATDTTGLTGTSSGWINIRGYQLRIPDTSVQLGYGISLPVYVTDLTGINVVSGSFEVSFSSNYLSFDQVITIGTLLNGYGAPTVNSNTPGKVQIVFAGTTPLAGSGVLVYVRFNTLNPGGLTVSINNPLFNQTLVGNTDQGNVSISSIPSISVSPSTATLIAGETQLFTAGGGTPPYLWSVSNTTVASIDPLSGILTAQQSGTTQVQVLGYNGGTGNSGNITVYDTEILVADSNAIVGTDILLPVYCNGFQPGVEVWSMEGRITVDNPELVPVGINTAGSLANGWTAISDVDGNVMDFAIAGATPVSAAAGGILFFVEIHLTGAMPVGYTAWVNLTNFLMNEGFPLGLIENGSIRGDPPCGKDGFEPNDDLGTAVNLYGGAVGGFLNTHICPQGDADWFWFESPAPNMVGKLRTNWLGGTLHFNLYNDTGGIINNGNGTGSADWDLPLAYAGRYYLQFSGLSGNYSASDPYSFSMNLAYAAPPGGLPVKPNIKMPVFRETFEGTDLQLYPNPVAEILWVDLYASGLEACEFVILDITGRRLRLHHAELNRGANHIRMDLTGLPAGAFLLQMKEGDRLIVRKFLKVE